MAHILIVEDEIPLLTAYQEILSAHGHKVTAAKDGETALKATAASTPDLILLDLKLPGMCGMDFLRQLYAKSNKQLKSAVVIFSNQEVEADIEEAYSLGAKKYILKAWASPRNLVKVVDEVLAA